MVSFPGITVGRNGAGNGFRKGFRVWRCAVEQTVLTAKTLPDPFLVTIEA
jgi:hypothetical protein